MDSERVAPATNYDRHGRRVRCALNPGCADFVVAGAISETGRAQPDIIMTLLHAKPLILGPAGRESLLVQSAIAAGAVMAADNLEQVFSHASYVLEHPDEAKIRAEAGKAWLRGQAQAEERILSLLR